MELAASRSARQSSGLTVAGVAELLGEDEGWLHEISINMDPEEGCLWVIGAGDDECPAFTEHGIECLKQIITEERVSAAARESNT